MLVYLAEPRGNASIFRDYMFFRYFCGIRRIFGLPLSPSSLRPKHSSKSIFWEREAERLARQIRDIGTIDFTLSHNWNLNLSSSEILQAAEILKTLPQQRMGWLLGLSIGTKQDINDWGDDNWRSVLQAPCATKNGGAGADGASHDRSISEKIAEAWTGPVLNLCGSVTSK